MDEYSLMLTSRALRDLDEIYGYIAGTLQEPGTALKLVDKLEEELFSLSQMPCRCPERKCGAYANRGYRQLFVKNFIALYRIDEENQQVIVVTVRHAQSSF